MSTQPATPSIAPNRARPADGHLPHDETLADHALADHTGHLHRPDALSRDRYTISVLSA
jgi:hypothetical protein